MIKYAIPSVLTAVVLVAGIFAFMPINEVSTVHTTIQGTQLNIEIDEFVDLTPAAADTYTIDCGTEDAVVMSITLDMAADTDGGDEDIEWQSGGDDVAAMDDLNATGDGETDLLDALAGATLSIGLPLGTGDDLIGTLAGSHAANGDYVVRSAVIVDNNGTCTFTE